jgi:outer membrane protein assembly factor BamA
MNSTVTKRLLRYSPCAPCICIYLCLGILPLTGLAQTGGSTIERILVDGPSHFADSRISLASGLQFGQAVDDSILSKAADRLAQTGAFSEVSYQYETLNGKMTVAFHVVDQTKTLACTFDNFVWFTPEEIDRAIHAEAPLYDGQVPLNGSLPEDVKSALEHLLAQRHVAASVTYLPAAKSPSEPPTEFRYSANGNLPLVTSVEFAGGPLDPALFDPAKQRLVGRSFSMAYSRLIAEKDLDSIYRNHAYLKAHFSDPQVSLAAGPGPGDPGSVSLVFSVTPGIEYKWHGADWSGNTVYTAPDLATALGMVEGTSAALDKILAGMASVAELYGKKGYVNAKLAPAQSFNDAAGQVRYSFDISEGKQFRMGTLTVSGYDSGTADRIRKAWGLKSGDIYDASYLKAFARTDFRDTLAVNQPGVILGHTSIATTPNADALTVDVLVSLSTK